MRNRGWNQCRQSFTQSFGADSFDANHLGLYAEQTSVSGEALRNFPQAFTHLGLISAAFNLDPALGPKR